MTESKTQIFRQSKTSNYSMIHNQILRRNDISWKAKGIMCYILSLPDDWVIYLEELSNHATDKITSFKSGWKELQEAGYVRRYPVKNEKGVITEWRTEVREYVDISTTSPQSGYPLVDDPLMDKPLVENQPLLSTNNTNDLNILNTDNTKTCQKYSDEHFRLASLLHSNLKNDFKKEMEKADLDKWADTIRLMEEQDERTIQQIEYVLNWLPTNDFYFKTIRSPKKLREKIELIFVEIKNEKEKKKNQQTKNHYGKPLKTEVVPKFIEQQEAQRKNKQQDSDTSQVAQEELDERLASYLASKEAKKKNGIE
ncbi:hypothetical protein [Enterococcus sp. AZ102]|uniref:hypothetical protein n=1 Tax=Enterococcus sp. AZ102 TaxID=2774865 RepID=UPI003F298C60